MSEPKEDTGRFQLTFTVMKRDSLKEFYRESESLDAKAFYTIESVKRVSED